jgi:hypothetical protein
VKQLCFLFFSLFLYSATFAQNPTPAKSEPQLIQFSGMLFTADFDHRMPVPYATVSLPNKGRGTYTDYRGFFTIVVEKGDKVRFNCIGFKPYQITIPDTLTDDRYSMAVLISEDTIKINTVVIMPWPKKEFFKIEFLKMDVTPELQRQAQKNLANNYLAEARKNPDIVPYGGTESANFYLRQKSREYYYIGQTPPMNIFSPLAWGQFFKAWKDGKFKRKKEDEDSNSN